MKLLNYKYAIPAICLLFLSSCDIINPEEKIAAYVYVDFFELEDNPNVSEGSLDHSINNVQVFVDGDYLGIYTLPALVPVLQEGEKVIFLDPVIRLNGQTFTLGIYPFYERYTGSVDLIPTEVDTVHPVVRYTDGINFAFVEDFELGGTIFDLDRDGNEETFLDVTTEEVFEGDRSGVIFLDRENAFIDVGTTQSDLFPLGEAQQIWLEVNFKSEVGVLYGLLGYDNLGAIASSFNYGTLAKEEWRKIYFNLTADVIESGFDDYGIAITAGLPFEGGDFTLDSARIYLDNIKLIYK